MNTKLIMAVLAVVVVGGGVWFLSQKDTTDAPANVLIEEQGDSAQKENPLSGAGSLANLMARGQDIECTFSSVEEGTKTEGTFMFSDGRYRVDSSVTTDGVTYITNIINTDERNYIWGNGPEGEMAIVIDNNVTNADETANSFAANPNNFASSVEDNVQYDCSRWSPDPSAFVPPSDIEFVDMQAELKEAFGGELPDFPEGEGFPEGFDPSNFDPSNFDSSNFPQSQ